MAASGKIGRTERLQLDDVSRREPVTLRRNEHSVGRSTRRGAGAALGPSPVGARARRWSSCGTWAETEGAELGSERRGGGRPELEGDGGVELGRERLEWSSTGTRGRCIARSSTGAWGQGGARAGAGMQGQSAELHRSRGQGRSAGPPRRRRGGLEWRASAEAAAAWWRALAATCQQIGRGGWMGSRRW